MPPHCDAFSAGRRGGSRHGGETGVGSLVDGRRAGVLVKESGRFDSEALILLEKVVPHGPVVGKAAGLGLVVVGVTVAATGATL